VITETDDVARALDVAAQRWPEDRNDRRRLLLRLIHAGCVSAEEERDAHTAAGRDAIARTSGALTGLYEEGYLERLREDWPT
jgi:hypothetical protein